MWCDVKPSAGGALVGKGFDGYGFAQLVLLNGANSEILLSNPNRAPATGSQTARWDFPEEIRTTPPDVVWQSSPVMRGDDLCLYRNLMSATKDGFQADLYYFAKGQKSGLKIPLKFQAQGNQNPILLSRQSAIYNYQSLQSTDYGLIIVQAMGGFWVVPWREIDAYRAQFAGGSVQTAANPAAPVTPPTPSPMAPQTVPSAPLVAPGTIPPPLPSTPVTPPVTPAPVTPSDPSGHD
jgi:hypothetical protein